MTDEDALKKAERMLDIHRSQLERCSGLGRDAKEERDGIRSTIGVLKAHKIVDKHVQQRISDIIEELDALL